jgi:two-component sensor histidine kinase
MRMLLDSKHHLWIGTAGNAVFEFDMKQRKVIRHITYKERGEKGIIFPRLWDMCFLNDSTLLLASTGGVELLNINTSISIPLEFPGVRTNNINALAVCKDNHIYLAGPNGLSRLTLPDMKLYQYGTADGLLNSNYSEGAHIQLSNGMICFGTARNFIVVNEKISSKQQNAKAIITGIRIMNKSMAIDSVESLQSPVELTYDRNYVAIDFACPAMLLNPTNTFLYKMEGFDKEWRISDQYPTAEYSNLPPGTYMFLLKYRNTDGKESNLTSAIPFIIHPPFWKTWWFIALVSLVILSFLYLLHRIRINKLLTMEKVRVHIARDLHDDMGSTLSSINILSVMSNKTLEKEPFKTKEYLVRISEYSQRMMETMDDIVWSINPLNDTMQKIVARMRELAATILEPKDIEYRFYVDEHVEHIKLDMGKRREFFLIYKEALNNMAKYSDCSRSIIHITTKKKRLLMHIEDNGKGFDEAIINDGNGLINMRKRAESLDGRLLIHSVIGQGTEITLNIPVS